MSPERHSAKRPRLGERTMLACIGCKQKKLKCDGQTPKCRNCERTGRDCLVEDPSTGLHRPRDYMKSLEARVAFLEGLLQETRPEVALDHFSGGGEEASTYSPESLSRTRVPIDAPDAAVRSSSTAADQQQPDALSSEVALLCLNVAGREPRFFGASSAVSFSRIVSATMGLRPTFPTAATSRLDDAVGARLASTNSSGGVRAAHRIPVRMPTPEMRHALTEAYFMNIHPQYPFLHRPTFQAWEDECRRAASAGGPDMCPDMSLFSTLMVYAIGSLVLGQAHYDSAESFYAMALDRISPILDMDNLESIQATLFCAVYSIRSPVGVNLWKVSGMAIRHCIELGYHLDAERYHRNANPLRKEMAKRCFWVAYDIDRVAAFTLGRPLGIPEDSISVGLPLDVDDDHITANGLSCSPRSEGDPPSLMTGVIHAIKLRRLWTKMSDHLYSQDSSFLCDNSCSRRTATAKLRGELEEWRASTPDQLNHSPSHPLSVFASKSWFQLAYDHSILLLYRQCMIGTHGMGQGVINSDPDSTEEIERILEECFLRAKNICLIYRRIYQGSSVQFTWGSIHILFLGGLTYLFCFWRSPRLRSKTKQSDFITTCLACSTVLIIVAERWNLATSYRDIFEALSQRTISMVCGDSENSAHPPPPVTSTAEDSGHQPQLQDLLEPQGEPQADLQDWLVGLDDLNIPQESEWLVQELLRGVNEFSA